MGILSYANIFGIPIFHNQYFMGKKLEFFFSWLNWFFPPSFFKGSFGTSKNRCKVVAITQKINAEKLLNVVVADQLKDKHMSPKIVGKVVTKMGPWNLSLWVFPKMVGFPNNHGVFLLKMIIILGCEMGGKPTILGNPPYGRMVQDDELAQLFTASLGVVGKCPRFFRPQKKVVGNNLQLALSFILFFFPTRFR